MKKLLLLITVLASASIQAQSSKEDEAAVKAKVIEFFDAFHKQDTVALKAMASDKVTLQSIASNREGKTMLNESDYNTFIKSIAGIPKDKKFEEKLLGFSIQVDGKMANAWTPYEFWFDGNFSHCGVNSFQFIKEDGDWKLLYLVDTRRRQGCKD